MARTSTAESLKERFWAIVGRRQGAFWYGRRQRPAVGDRTSVEFDAAWTLRREETRGDVIGFCHTHSAGPAEPSRRDVRTMRAWAGAFGKPLLCLIETPGGTFAFRFDDDRSAGARLPTCEAFPRGVVIVFDPQTKES